MPWDNLSEMRNADITECCADELVDLRNIKLNRRDSVLKRAESFFEQVGNPYLFKVGETVVKVDFGDGKDFSEMLTDVILAG